MKTKLTTTIAALLLATSVQAADCDQSAKTTHSLLIDLQSAMAEMHEAGPDTSDDELNRLARAVMRRAVTLKSSLISIRVYCHHSAEALSWANGIEDMTDELGVQ